MHFTSLVCYKMATKCPGEGSSLTKRKKTRRGKKWRNLEERRTFIDAYMKQRRHRAAPWNTTQFLMDDREKVEPILCLSPATSTSSHSSPEGEGSEDIDNLRNMDNNEELDRHFDEQFFVKDFETTYRQLYRENLYSLSKPELLEKVKKLESKRDVLENEWRCCSSGARRNPNQISSESLTREFKQLQEQNDSLRKENSVLRKPKEEVENEHC